MRTRLKILEPFVIFLIFAVASFGFGIKPAERAEYESPPIEYYNLSGEIVGVEFEEVILQTNLFWEIKTSVKIPLKNSDAIAVKIDPGKNNTTVSVVPKFLDRVTPQFFFVIARSVTIWTKDKNEEKYWKKIIEQIKSKNQIII